jgi:hypothetical protein
MTSLNETLPILDEAVPALPARLEEVAKESDVFHQAAADAVAALQGRREQAQSFVAAVRQALESLQEQARSEEQRVAESARAVEQASEERLRELDQAEDRIETEGEDARAALGALESRLEAGTQRVGAAHEDARAALAGLGEEARTREPELQAAGDAVEQAFKGVQQAVDDGQQLVAQGVQAVKDAMERLLGETQARLAQTHAFLDDVRAEHETAVNRAVAEITADRARVSQEIAAALETGVDDALTAELDAVVSALAEAGQQVVQLEAETQSRREELADQVAEVESRIGPLQGGVQEVKVAADRLGIDW